MDSGEQNIESNAEVGNIEETPLGGREFRGSVETRDPLAPALTPAPDGIPEKFWDPIEGKLRTEDLVKSYAELEKKIGQPKADEEVTEEATEETAEETEETSEETPEETEEETPEETEEETNEEPSEALTSAIESAKAAYAETGDLSEEARKPLLEAGISNEQIDFYIQGVKATEAALHTTAHEVAGGEDALQAAMAWAAKNWSDKKKTAFNGQMHDVETIKLAVPGLMAEFRAANPGEGQLTNINSGVNRGDVYGSMAEFQQDLARATTLRDQVARSKAIAKLRRSREAGTVKSNRNQPFGR